MSAADYFLVPLTGIEPVRILLRGILSPLCLPVPPQRRVYAIISGQLCRCPVAVPGRNFACQSRLVPCRPRPLAPLASSVPGGARVAPRALTDADLPQGIKSDVSACSTTAADCSVDSGQLRVDSCQLGYVSTLLRCRQVTAGPDSDGKAPGSFPKTSSAPEAQTPPWQPSRYPWRCQILYCRLSALLYI